MKTALLLLFLLVAPVVAQEVRYPQRELRVEGRTWTYHYAVPENPEAPLMVVILLHGAGGSGGSYLARTGWGEKALAEGFLVVAPSAPPVQPDQPADFASNPRLWNTGGSLKASRAAIEDWPFFEALLTDVAQRWSTRRFYCVGHSNGGSMTFALAQRWPGNWAAIATVAAPPPAAGPSSPVPTLTLLGEQDKVVPWEGGDGATPWGPRKFKPMRPALDGWARSLGCTAPAAVEWSAGPEGSKKLDYGNHCEVLLVPEQGHSWPGWHGTLPALFGPTREDFNSTDLIWDFFSRHL